MEEFIAGTVYPQLLNKILFYFTAEVPFFSIQVIFLYFCTACKYQQQVYLFILLNGYNHLLITHEQVKLRPATT